MAIYWITEEVLKYGIREAHGEPYGPAGVKCWLIRDPFAPTYWVLNKNVHTTLEAAQRRAEEVRQKRLASLERQIEQLRSLRIAVVPMEDLSPTAP